MNANVAHYQSRSRSLDEHDSKNNHLRNVS